ncbi:hypothetical protein ABMX69_20030 [Vibrio vulnificus]|uniref:hypothetical protein n=1 Tax=Vibrio vulnificus TaxID=672 RepID=UPI001029A031|nr:hypothetical protein [Vibrio vulnificus]RZQ38631.1 hypothetical protein D8T41_15380 [Vibrio vulnificus]HDY7507901.1 hypothetical protein [Vibrio vulnificus]
MSGSSVKSSYVGCYTNGTAEYEVFKDTQISYFRPLSGKTIAVEGMSSYYTSDGQDLNSIGDDFALLNGDVLTKVKV